jgi:hypothetical protein
MTNSPWDAYGRLPLDADKNGRSNKNDVLAGVVNEVVRGREQLDKYLSGAVREFFEIQNGRTGYRNIIDSALAPSPRPESIEERLSRFAREAAMRRPNAAPGTRPRRPR